MHPDLKKTLKSLSLELRHLLEGYHDAAGRWHAGDMEQRLNALGVWRDRAPLPADELARHTDADRRARVVIDAYLALRSEAGVALEEAAAEFTRETAYTWANRLLALRCMEARGLIDEVILQKEVYGGRSLEHHRLARQQPELCLSADDGLLAALAQAFARQAAHLPLLFDPQSPAVALTPSAAAIKQCVALLSAADAQIFQAADALGWAYQYWNSEEKDRVFAKVRTQRGAKIEGADIIPATQLYTEPYMVQFLVQNSLGALWMGMYPDSKLYKSWAYYVRDADRAPVSPKPLREVTFLDPACGSGHFLLEAFDLFYAMYEEEGALITPEAICAAILEDNLYGIDIDERAVQIAEAALWMKAAEKAFDFRGSPANLVATNIRLPRGKDHLAAFLAQHPEDGDLRPALEVIFEGLQHADELGSLLQLEEPVEKELRYLQAKMQERRGKPEQAVLFPELEKPKQGELPLGVESYAEWKTRTLARLKQHFAAEAQAADLGQAFFGRSAHKGVRLFDLLARRYDVVAANPPYMGSGNMGTTLKAYIQSNYRLGKQDLFAAFVLRCIQMVLPAGRGAMITQQSWMFLRAFADFRSASDKLLEATSFKGVLREVSLETLAHLGPSAFGEISGEVVNTVMFIWANVVPNDSHKLLAIRLIGIDGPSEKRKYLVESVSNSDSTISYAIPQSDLFEVEESPLVYWLPDQVLKLLKSDLRLGSIAYAGEGFCTRDESRFVRYYWETKYKCLDRWIPYSKGGGYCRWSGLMHRVVDYRHQGQVVIQRITEKYPYLHGNVGLLVKDTDYYFKPGLTYSDFGRGALGIRLLPEGSIFSDTAPGVFPLQENEIYSLAGLLNSRVNSFIIRTICTGMRLPYRYVVGLPVPEGYYCHLKQLSKLSCAAIKLKELEDAFDLVSPSFVVRSVGQSLTPISIDVWDNYFLCQSVRHTVEGILEVLVFNEVYNFSDYTVHAILGDTGITVGWFPCIDGYDTLPQLELRIPVQISEVDDLSQCYKRELFLPETIFDIKCRLQMLYEAGPGADLVDEAEQQDQSDESVASGHIPIPAETFLEELSQKLHIHPISVYWLLKEGIEQEGWRCRPEERRLTADRFTVLILRLLGHRWPKQIEAGEPVPPWADPDGVIPLTEGTHKPTLLERVRERLAAEFAGGEVAALEREFQEVMGQSLEAWLGQTFFKHHTRQFKKRPVAWQVQSGRWTARQQPAFACLVYYHKLDGDTLVTLQSQYVRPLRQRYEVELRGIESIPAAARSPRQDARRVELGDLIRELSDFDAALGRVADEGFACSALQELIIREPLDQWCSADGVKAAPDDVAALLRQEQRYTPDLNDGVRVNVAPLQAAGLLAADVLAKKDLAPAIADRAEWRADERRWCREGKLPRPGWWE